MVPPTRAQVPQDSWSTLWDIRHRPESPRRVGRHCGPSGPARVARDSWSTPRSFGHVPKSPGTAGRPQDLGPEPEMPGRVGRHCGPSGTGPCRPGQMVKPTGPQTWAGVSWDRWSTPENLGPKHKSPGTAGGPGGPQTRSQVAWDSWWARGASDTAQVTRVSWSTPRALGLK